MITCIPVVMIYLLLDLHVHVRTCTYMYAHLSHTNMSVIYNFLLVLLRVSFLNQVAGLFDKPYVKSAIMTTMPYMSHC